MKREGYCICIYMRVMAAECPGDSKKAQIRYDLRSSSALLIVNC